MMSAVFWKARLSDDQVAAVIERTLHSKPKDATHWSIRSMASEADLSHTTIRRIWGAFGLQPHRSETFKLPPILFVDKVQDSIVYSDCRRGYNVLDVSEFKHFRINHSELFADAHNHINGIENFWNQDKRNMRKFNGVPKAQFGLYLKECEWRFNNSDPSVQLSQLKQWVKCHLR